MRDYLGHTIATIRTSANQYELALGDHARSGEQFDIWQAVYGPVGSDGYPAANLQQGNRRDRSDKIAAYWKEHYDLSNILQRNWSTLGPKLRGKLRIYVGSADNYMLNNAVYLIEDFLKTTAHPNPPTKAKSSTATAPNTAGTATPPNPTISRASTTTRCTSR